MKLVLLPGMDGTGDLFSPLLECLPDIAYHIIPLPQHGAQDYPTLITWVEAQLPLDDIVIVAESYSGPIGAALAATHKPNIKGIIFVATFLSPPNPWLIHIARILPLRQLLAIPLIKPLCRLLLLGPKANPNTAALLLSTIKQLPNSLIKSRLNSLLHLPLLPTTPTEKHTIPACYIQANGDQWVSHRQALAFFTLFEPLSLVTVKGSHFVLQANPEDCAEAINRFMDKVR